MLDGALPRLRDGGAVSPLRTSLHHLVRLRHVVSTHQDFAPADNCGALPQCERNSWSEFLVCRMIVDRAGGRHNLFSQLERSRADQELNAEIRLDATVANHD